jgi:hypothetical protein
VYVDAYYIIFIGFPIVPQEIPQVQYRTAKNRKMPTKKAPAAEKCAGGEPLPYKLEFSN